MKKRTLVLGASENTERYAAKAIQRLLNEGHEVVAVGLRKGNVHGVTIYTQEVIFENIDTITLYVGPKNQLNWYKYILTTNPKRIIFNPGTENVSLEILASEKGIEVISACTLVLLATGIY